MNGNKSKLVFLFVLLIPKMSFGLGGGGGDMSSFGLVFIV